MSALPEQADLLDDSHPSDAEFQRKKFSINANQTLLPSKGPSRGSAPSKAAPKPAGAADKDKPLSCGKAARKEILRAMWSLRFQRPWEWPSWLQITMNAVLVLIFFYVVGRLPVWMGAVGDKQLPTPDIDTSDSLFEARFELMVSDLSYNTFSPSPSSLYTVLCCGMFFVALIIFTML